MQLTRNSIITIETGNMTFEGRVLRDIDDAFEERIHLHDFLDDKPIVIFGWYVETIDYMEHTYLYQFDAHVWAWADYWSAIAEENSHAQ